MPNRTQLGLVSYCLTLRQQAWQRRREAKSLSDPLTFLEECHALGAGGVQTALGLRDHAYAHRLRQRAAKLDMHVEATLELPRREADVAQFEQQVITAVGAGVAVARTTLLPGRRYEQFNSREGFEGAVVAGRRALQWAEPILARHRLRLAVENHKDQRVPERLALLRDISSEYVGVCVDVANSVALLEDPLEVVRAYAPWALSVHLKDMVVREYEEGFLLGDAALGAGVLDLPTILSVLRQAKSDLRFNLEVITRDPLKVPVLTGKYWATLTDVPASDLAQTLGLVKARRSAQPLPEVSKLPPERQIEEETRNIVRSLEYARERLAL